MNSNATFYIAQGKSREEQRITYWRFGGIRTGFSINLKSQLDRDWRRTRFDPKRLTHETGFNHPCVGVC
jgi:hypothetical protein